MDKIDSTITKAQTTIETFIEYTTSIIITTPVTTYYLILITLLIGFSIGYYVKMAPVNPFTSRLRATLKMAINRLRLVEQKETALAKQARREMAQLLEAGKEQSARIRVENIIRQDINVELLEILELYCELLLARIGLLDQKECDPGLEEAVKTVIYASQRTEVKELHQIREILLLKFGKDFAKDAVDNLSNIVPEKVLKRLSVEPPKEELVTLYLAEIARAYHVPFSGLPKEELEEEEEEDDDDDGPPSGRVLEQPITSDGSSTTEKVRRLSQVSQLPDPDAPKSPVSVSTPGPTTDNPHPVLKISTTTSRPNGKAKSAEEKELDALRDRFEALRRR